MACQHFSQIKEIKQTDVLFKEECCFCFEDEDVFICLVCYLGFCSSHREIHSKASHFIYGHIKKHLVNSPKVSKLDSCEAAESTHYEVSLCCFQCNFDYRKNGLVKQVTHILTR